ncbi:MAG: hypothetical protein PHP86_01165 [Nevskiales bacterium]|nr:hypothetical protein [Nevskiales bacterium]
MNRTVNAPGLTDKEVMLIKSYLTLLPGKTRDDWTYLDSGVADAEIVPAGREPRPGTRVVIAYGDDNAAGPTLCPPLRIAGVIGALDRASARLQGEAAEATSPMVAEVRAAMPSDPATLARRLRAWPQDQTRLLLSDGTLRIEADRQLQRYRASQPLSAVPLSQSGWTEARSAPGELAHEGALTELLWRAGVADAQVDPGFYRLRRWPDFGRLPHRPSFVKLAAYFARHGSSPWAAAKAVLVPQPDVDAFLGGCVMAGFATRLDQPPAQVEPRPAQGADAGLRRLLTTVRRRLGLAA